MVVGQNLQKERGIGGEIAGVVIAALALFLIVAFSSYQPGNPQSNLAGQVGHLFAEWVCPALGLAAYLLPLYLFCLAGALFRLLPFPAPVLQSFFFSVFLLSVAVLFALWYENVEVSYAGGWIGGFLAFHVCHLFNRPGAYIVLLPLLLLSFMGATRLSLVRVGMGLGVLWGRGRSIILGACQWCRVRLQRKKSQRKDLLRKGRIEKPDRQEEWKSSSRGTPPIILTGAEADRRQLTTDGRLTPEFNGGRRSVVGGREKGGQPYSLPPLSFLDPPVRLAVRVDEEALHASSRILENKLADFGVEGKVVAVRPGPVITTYEFEPAPGVKVSRIVALADDLSMVLRAVSVRVLAPIPGKAVVGIEVSNPRREKVCLREILDSNGFRTSESVLTLALGKDTIGSPVVADLTPMPHLLVAGATGTGKSVFLNATIMSLLYKASPQQVRFIMIDPKMLELSLYEDVPHLLSHVVTNPREAGAALQEVVRQMEYRYKLLHDKGVRSISAYNRLWIPEEEATGEVIRLTDVVERGEEIALSKEPGDGAPLKHQRLPYLVVVVDELADLMLTVGREIEEPIIRLAQMGRAAGIHLILATQRPSVDVITGLIKANFPARASFQVSSRVDSRTVLDTMGAERLLGDGDMLFLSPGTARPRRIHGTYVSEAEVRRVVGFIKKQAGPSYDADFLAAIEQARQEKAGEAEEGEDYDEMYEQARELVIESRQASISWLQRRLRVGYNRAARMIERMEREGLVAPAAEAGKPREVLVHTGRRG